MKYERCHKCGVRYNVSALRDNNKVFICQDCENRERAKMNGKKARAIYDKLGYARVTHFLLAVLLVPFLFGFAKYNNEIKPFPVPLDTELQQHIISVSDAYNVDPAIVMGIIEKESQFDANAIGDNGDSYGLMQVNAQYHGDRMQELGVTNLLCPYCNVLVGIDYFAECLEKYGDVHKALIVYNAGAGKAYDGWFSVGRYQSDYSREVMDNTERIGDYE